MTSAIDTYNIITSTAAIPAGRGIWHAISVSHFTLRAGATKRGMSHFIPKCYMADPDAAHWALFGRP